MKWRTKIANWFQRMKPWLSRNVGFFVYWAILVFFFVFSLAALLGYFGLWERYRTLALVLDFILVTVFMLILISDLIPRRTAIAIRSYIPIFMAVVFLVPTAIIFILGTPILLEYLSNAPLEIGEALSISIALTVIISVFVIFKGVFCWIDLRSYLPHLQVDLHHLVCDKIGNTQQALKDSRWYRTYEEEPEIMLANRKRVETSLEIQISAFIALLALFLYFRVFTITGFWSSDMDNMAMLLVGYLMLLCVWTIIGELRDYRIWRHLWFDYWNFVRNMTASGDTILDSMEPLRYSMKTRVMVDDKTLLADAEAEELAEEHGIEMTDIRKREEIEYVFWYDYVTRKLEEMESRLLDKFSVYREFKERFNELDNKYPEEFISLLRSSQILEVAELAERMPAIFESIADTDAWSLIADDTRQDVYELAIRQLDSLRNLGAAPIPSSIAWLFGLFVFSISVVPYALTVGSAIIAP